MTKEQLHEVKEELSSTLRSTVNGKIDAMNIKLDNHMESAQAHWERSNTFMIEMLPVRDAFFTLRNINKVMQWFGIPAVIAFITYLFTKS